MSAVYADASWTGYALTGRPDFLNYLRRGDVSWRDLWRFYHENPADPGVMIRMSGLFHMFLSADYDREGCVLDRDGRVYPQLREWAQWVVQDRDYLPEEKLRDSLAGLLSQSLISPQYYEAVFSVYLEACLEHHARACAAYPVPMRGGSEASLNGRLSTRLAELPLRLQPGGGERWDDAVTAEIARHYATWNAAYASALGEDDENWLDEGGEG